MDTMTVTWLVRRGGGGTTTRAVEVEEGDDEEVSGGDSPRWRGDGDSHLSGGGRRGRRHRSQRRGEAWSGVIGGAVAMGDAGVGGD